MHNLMLPSSLMVPAKAGSDLGSGPSAAIIGKYYQAMNSGDGSRGLFLGDDFQTFGLVTAISSNAAYYGSSGIVYKSYEDSTGTVAQVLTLPNGVLRLTTDGGDNDENWIQPHLSNHAVIHHDTVASRRLVGWECRFKLDSVADNVQAIFLGLSEESRAVADQKVDDTGVLADKDFIGFDSVHANGGTAGTNAILTFKYNKASGSGPITAISNVQAMAAATWYKAGFLYDPAAPPSRRLKVYVDGANNANYVTETEIDTSTDFPDGEMLGTLLGHKDGSTTAANMDIDWWYSFTLAV